MGYTVIGFIVNAEHARQIAAAHPQLKGAPLEQGFTLFPLTDEKIDSLLEPSETHEFSGFHHLSQRLFAFLERLSAGSPVLYFETEYFGGLGEQSAIVLHEGKVVYGPRQDKIGPISEALRLMGARKQAGDFDEFASVGLARHRSSEDWLESEDK
jgi:hypothetical protein